MGSYNLTASMPCDKRVLMRLISRSAIREFLDRRPECVDASEPLSAWYREVKRAEWKTSADIKVRFRSVSFLHDNKVVFNIWGNKYRLIVRINYGSGIVYILFIGTHKEYDKINAEEV